MKPKPDIVFYVTDYGYGHASRSIALIRELLLPKYNIGQITICSGHVLSFIQNSLPYDHRLKFREQSLDLGYVHELGSINLSLSLLQEMYINYQSSFSAAVSRERDFLRSQKIEMVISDISPIPFLATSQLKITSLGISNFSWYTAYEEALTREIMQLLRQSYQCMDYYVRLPGGEAEPGWGLKGEISVGFYCRRIEIVEMERIRRRLDPHKNRIIIFFALGMSIDLVDISKMKLLNHENFIFIVSNNMEIYGNNVYRINDQYTETQNFVAASDIVITKPGWSTISEAIVYRKPLVLLKRANMPEDRNTIEAARKATNTVTIHWNELRDIDDPSFFQQMIVSSQNSEWEDSESYETKFSSSEVGTVARFIGNLLNDCTKK
jgi:hypothetical protein